MSSIAPPIAFQALCRPVPRRNAGMAATASACIIAVPVRIMVASLVGLTEMASSTLV